MTINSIELGILPEVITLTDDAAVVETDVEAENTNAATVENTDTSIIPVDSAHTTLVEAKKFDSTKVELSDIIGNVENDAVTPEKPVKWR